MSWVNKRIKQYNQGEKATWLEKRLLEHAEPVNLTATIISIAMLFYGLWFQNWTWIIIGFVVGFLGHLYGWFKK